MIRILGLLLLLALGGSLGGCTIYGHQPSTMRVPTIDSAGQLEVWAGGGLSRLPYVQAGVQASLGPNLLVGATAGQFSKGSGGLEERYKGQTRHYEKYDLYGTALGLQAGAFTRQGWFTLYLIGGADIESHNRIFEQYEYTGWIRQSDLLRYEGKAHYTKLWLQPSVRYELSEVSFAAAALRFSSYNLQESQLLFRPVPGSTVTRADYPAPTDNFWMIDMLVQGTHSIFRPELTLSAGLQFTVRRAPYVGNSAELYWLSPAWSVMGTIGYRFNLARRKGLKTGTP